MKYCFVVICSNDYSSRKYLVSVFEEQNFANICLDSHSIILWVLFFAQNTKFNFFKLYGDLICRNNVAKHV